MIKKLTILTFMSVFSFVVSTPNISMLFQHTIEVEVLLDMNEEEKNESETSKEKEIKILELDHFHHFSDTFTSKESTYDLQRYAPVYLNLLSPPPDFS